MNSYSPHVKSLIEKLTEAAKELRDASGLAAQKALEFKAAHERLEKARANYDACDAGVRNEANAALCEKDGLPPTVPA